MDDTRETTELAESRPADVPSGGPLTVEGHGAMTAPISESEASASANAVDDSARTEAEPQLATGEGTAEWVEQGMVDVPVRDLPDPDGVSGPEDFDHHITYDDALHVTREIQTMKPLIDAGYTGDDFAAEDSRNGVDYEHGRQRIYDLYYGSDAIRLNKDGDTYDIVHGRHRIYAAKVLGFETIPANVVEKVYKDSDG